MSAHQSDPLLQSSESLLLPVTEEDENMKGFASDRTYLFDALLYNNSTESLIQPPG